MTPHTITSWHLILRHHDTSYYDTLMPRTATETTYWHLMLWHHDTSYYNIMTPHTTKSCHLILQHIDTSYCDRNDLLLWHHDTSYYVWHHHTWDHTSNLHVSSFLGNFWPSWTDFMCLWRWVFHVALNSQSGHENFWPSFMDRFYVCRKVWLPCCFVFTMWAWVLFAFMDWFNVSLKASSWVALHSQCEHGNFWPSWTDFMCALRCLFCDDL